MQRKVAGCFFLFFSLVVLTVYGLCPNNCSNRGTCVANRCRCNEEWAGEDCSYILKRLTNGVPYSEQNLPTFGWSYFYIAVPSKENMVWMVNQTSDGDCDLYIKDGTPPTRTSYYMRDISVNREMVISVPNAPTGMWYAGVYGFIQCSYSIAVRIEQKGTCPHGCSGHGTCDTQGVCHCNPGWIGDDCATPNVLVPNGPAVSGVVAQGEWKFYTTEVSSSALLVYTLYQLSPGDADIYLNLNSEPRLIPGGYIAANLSSDVNSTINFEVLVPGTYYLGILGFWGNSPGVSYNLSLTTSSGSCDKTTHCSGPDHGTCLPQGNCRCNGGYNGSSCENKKDPLSLGETVRGYVADSEWNFYHYLGLSNNEIVISVTQESQGNSDCDLYVRANKRPTLMDYDYVEMSQLTTFNISVPQPFGSVWWVGVYGWLSCSYSLVIKERTDTDCGHGIWVPSTGSCVCDKGWTGVSCNIQAIELTNGVVTNGTVVYNKWSYFSIFVDGARSVEVRMKEQDKHTALGATWLYTSIVQYPTLHTYDQSDTTTDDKLHSITYTSKQSPFFGTFYIGVYGSPYAKAGEVNNFSVIAWYPDF